MTPLTVLVLVLAALAVAAAAAAWLQHRRARRLAHDLARAREHARRADEAAETFFDLATHELRSPLAAILGYQELLQDGAYGDLSTGAADAISRIGRSADHLLHLIDGVIELGRLRAGGLRPELGPVDLDAVFRNLAESFRSHTDDRNITADVRLPDRLDVIHSDQPRLVRALDLLITSAVRHPAGQRLTLEVEPEQAGVTVLVGPTRIELADQLDDPDLRLGIRLAVADRLATLLGGRLQLDADGQGIIHRLRFSIRDFQPDVVR